MIEVCALASGSNGNCYYIGNEKEAILIDAGINCKQMVLRMESRNLDPSKVKAVFISHEHIDHVAGARVFCNKHHIPAFFTQGTFRSLTDTHRPALYRFMEPGIPVTLGTFTVFPFAKNHDASEPCSFRIEAENHQIGVITDVGMGCNYVISNAAMCNILFLETNYDETMLWNGPYPWPLKKRIASDYGHLSNTQALSLVTEHLGETLDTLFLSHLSGENNTPGLASETFATLADRYKIITTSRHEASAVYRF